MWTETMITIIWIITIYVLIELELFKSQLLDSQQLLQQERDKSKQQIDNLQRRLAESLEIERSTMTSDCDLVIEQLQAKHQEEIEHIVRGKHYLAGIIYVSYNLHKPLRVRTLSFCQ